MKKIALLGDSIRMSYLEQVKQKLDGQYQIISPEDNCRFSSYTLFHLREWLPDNDYDAIHWNNGLWDVCYMLDDIIHTPIERYIAYQKRIVSILKTKAPRLIFANTTPIREERSETMSMHTRYNKDIEFYNAEIRAYLEKSGIEINDVHKQVNQNTKLYVCDDMLHLSEEGMQLVADCVVSKFL